MIHRPSMDPDSNALLPIRTVFIHVTKACNLACHYCYFSARKPLQDEFTRDDFTAFWPDLVLLAPKTVVFTGGEPLLRSDIVELLQGLKRADPMHLIKRCLNTNGHLMDYRLANELVGVADEVRVSLDGLRKHNDALRGDGNFEAAISALETLRDVGFEPKVLVTLTSTNLGDIEPLVELLLQKKITNINFNGFRQIGRGAKLDWLRADKKSTRDVLARVWERVNSDLSHPIDAVEQPDCQSHCGVGQFLNILPNGDVYPCHVLTNPVFRIGSLRRQSLMRICRTDGLLAQLSALDFRQLAAEDKTLSQLTVPNTCMGTVYSRTSTSRVWTKHLDLVQIQVTSEPSLRCCPRSPESVFEPNPLASV